eukprot:905408_1
MDWKASNSYLSFNAVSAKRFEPCVSVVMRVKAKDPDNWSDEDDELFTNDEAAGWTVVREEEHHRWEQCTYSSDQLQDIDSFEFVMPGEEHRLESLIRDYLDENEYKEKRQSETKEVIFVMVTQYQYLDAKLKHLKDRLDGLRMHETDYTDNAMKEEIKKTQNKLKIGWKDRCSEEDLKGANVAILHLAE